MKLFALALAVVVPLMAPWEEGPLPAPPPCHLGIDLQVRAVLPWGPVAWTVFTPDDDRIRAQYGVTLCWAAGDASCDGLRVRLRVVLQDESTGRAG